MYKTEDERYFEEQVDFLSDKCLCCGGETRDNVCLDYGEDCLEYHKETFGEDFKPMFKNPWL
jgi:hypothetical protein